jgi:hypothetical protein
MYAYGDPNLVDAMPGEVDISIVEMRLEIPTTSYRPSKLRTDYLSYTSGLHQQYELLGATVRLYGAAKFTDQSMQGSCVVRSQ